VKACRNALRVHVACLALGASPVWAQTWAVPAGEAPPGSSALGGEVSIHGVFAPGVVPEFRSAPRDRGALGVAASGWLGNRVRLAATWEWLFDQTSAAGTISGPGDVRLGTALRVGTVGVLRLGLGWEAKLPNARNEEELGTDETDITFGAWGRADHGSFRGGLAVGLAVLGNPLRYANQDDVPLVSADGGLVHGEWGASAFCALALPTPLNPARAEVGTRVRFGGTWFVEAEGAAGLTPAAADGRVLLRLGMAGGLPYAPSRE
jgi:hypothetical protein